MVNPEEGPSAAEPGDCRILRVHYLRVDGLFQGWGLHVWGEGVLYPTSWASPLPATGQESASCFWDVPLTADASALVGLIVHRGDTKAAGGQPELTIGPEQRDVFLVHGSELIHTTRAAALACSAGTLATSSAHWVAPDTILWRQSNEEAAYTTATRLLASRDAALRISSHEVDGVDAAFELEPIPDAAGDAVVSAALIRFPHLRGCSAFRLPAASDAATSIVSAQLAVVVIGRSGQVLRSTAVQMQGLLDERYYYDGPLGARDGSVSVWTPTAQRVELLRWPSASEGADPEVHAMDRDDEHGVWSCPMADTWRGQQYLFRVTVYHYRTQQIHALDVADPYARALTADGARCIFVDLDGDAALMPPKWRQHETPALEDFMDMSLYELHVRDFSISDDSVPEAQRGKYAAFSPTATGSQTRGQQHLQRLSAAGLTHVHLLPSYDFGSVPELPEAQLAITKDLRGFAPDSDQQQAHVARVAARDAYNWGYDPVNWGVPEGSYSSDARGCARIYEYRQMVQGLHEMGLRVVQDVVYNHTFASGLDRYSVLDKVVPGYYQRRDEHGAVCDSACCNNTATEHRMAERLMIDDLVHWATHYRIDGFRFDIMGHIMKSSMLAARSALDALNVAQHGVDGKAICIYGEAWDFGEVAANQRGLNLCQMNLTGTGMGGFSDAFRDAAMGGSPFAPPELQGLLTGLHTDPSPAADGSAQAASSSSRQELLDAADLLRIGMAGNLTDYKLMTNRGKVTEGHRLRAYGASPCETVNYVSCHDNETLYDQIVLKANHGGQAAVCADVVRLALGIIAVSQGLPFFHAGDDLLRSKSLDRDSYDSGDWFNALFWDRSSNNFGVGLPPASKNAATWPQKKRLLAMRGLRPDPDLIGETHEWFCALLALRYSSPLFRMRRAEHIIKQVAFENTGPEQTPGVLGMTLSSGDGDGDAPRDRAFEIILVWVNVRPDAVSVPFPDTVSALAPHPALEAWAARDGVQWDDAARTITLPPRTLAVLGQPWQA